MTTTPSKADAFTAPDPDVEVFSWGLPKEKMGRLSQALFEYCQDIKGGHAAPLAADFDILDLAQCCPAVLPHLWLLDVLEDRTRFRYRLIGGAIHEAGTAARVGDCVGHFDESGELLGCLRRLVDGRVPRLYRGPAGFIHASGVLGLEMLQVPLLDENAQTARIINCTAYDWEPGSRPYGHRI